jgi:hypothetical protein
MGMGLDSGTTNAYRGIVERAILRANEAPAPIQGSARSGLVSASAGFFVALDTHFDRLKEIRTDITLSQEGVRQAKQQNDEALERDAADAIGSFTTLATQYRERLEAAINEGATTVTEERLANARSDARMVLDSAHGAAIVELLKELADDDDDAMAHLLLRTKWPEYYLQSRGEEGMVPMWHDYRAALMGRTVSAEGMAAFQSLDAAKGLVEAAQGLNSALQFYEKDRTAGML